MTVSPLKIFARVPDETATVFIPQGRLDDIRSQAQKRGYALGYEQAREDVEANRLQQAAKALERLQDLHFSQSEARAAVLDSLEPLLRRMCDTILPACARLGLGTFLREQVMELADRQTGGQLSVLCADDDFAALSQELDALKRQPADVAIIIDPELETGVIRLKSTDGEKKVDLQQAVAGIQTAITEFFAQISEASSDGN